MIKHINGNLLKLADANYFDVIAHGCNCFTTFGAGLAPQIKDKYPEAYSADCATKTGDKNKLGTITHTKNTNPIVVNIYSQYSTTGRYEGKIDLDYNALRSGLQLMINKFSGKRFGLPMIGCGLAGGDEKIVLQMIEELFKDEVVTVVRYVP